MFDRIFEIDLLKRKEIAKIFQNYLVPFVERLAPRVQKVSLFFINTEDWPKLEQCLLKFANIQRLQLSINQSPPPPADDWLRNVIMANGQLKSDN